MNTFLAAYAVVLGVIVALMTLWWLVSLALRNSSIVDILWGTGFVVAVWVGFALTPGGCMERKLLLCLLVSIWGLRLSLHILRRNWGKPEDFRYQKWRAESGSRWWWYSYLKVFLLQGLLMWIISAPLLAAHHSPTPDHLTVLDILAVIVWLVGFLFETIGDRQLMCFKANPANRGQLLCTGVWRYTRHPNYFGDAAQWWAFFLIALAAGGWWTIFSPLLMTFLLVRVSGAALLERTLKDAKPGYAEYIATTSAFIPWFPRRKQ
jgi:steroid 5-alpha reductase family enzyme